VKQEIMQGLFVRLNRFRIEESCENREQVNVGKKDHPMQSMAMWNVRCVVDKS